MHVRKQERADNRAVDLLCPDLVSQEDDFVFMAQNGVTGDLDLDSLSDSAAVMCNLDVKRLNSFMPVRCFDMAEQLQKCRI